MGIDAKAFVETVRGIAARQPEKVYSLPTEYDEETGEDIDRECQYVEYDKHDDLVGSCLLGHALLELGVEPQKLDVVTMGFDTLAQNLDLGLPSAVVSWAVTVQDEQDDFKPWGVAVELADAFVSPAELELVTR